MNPFFRDRRQSGDKAAATPPRLSEGSKEHATTDVDKTTRCQHDNASDTETPALSAASRAVRSGSPECCYGGDCGGQNQLHGKPQTYTDPSTRRAGAVTAMGRGVARDRDAGFYCCFPASADGWPRQVDRRTDENENVSAPGHGLSHAMSGRGGCFVAKGLYVATPFVVCLERWFV